MTDKLTAGLARLRELERAATQPPWGSELVYVVNDVGVTILQSHTTVHTAAFVAEFRNVAGPLLDVADAVPELLVLIDDMSRFVGQMSLKDYQRFNEAPIKARRAIAALATAMEDNHD